jgi:hypothetical protein
VKKERPERYMPMPTPPLELVPVPEPELLPVPELEAGFRSILP